MAVKSVIETCWVLIEEVQDLKIQLAGKANEALNDKSIPLDERWNLFTELPDGVLKEGSFLQRFNNINENKYTWFDDFYFERYRRVDNVEVVEHILQEQELSNKFKDVDVDALKEEMIASGVRYWLYDW